MILKKVGRIYSYHIYFNFSRIGFRRISPSTEAAISHDDKEAVLEKKDSKESNSTITNEPTINRSVSYNQADHIAASNVNSVIEFDSLQRAITVPENLLHNLNINTDSGNTDTLQSELKEEAQDLAAFLIMRACRNSSLTNYFYWYLLIECEDQEHGVKQDVNNFLIPILR